MDLEWLKIMNIFSEESILAKNRIVIYLKITGDVFKITLIQNLNLGNSYPLTWNLQSQKKAKKICSNGMNNFVSCIFQRVLRGQEDLPYYKMLSVVSGARARLAPSRHWPGYLVKDGLSEGKCLMSSLHTNYKGQVI